MIDKALDFLRQELNTYLKLKTGDDKKINLSAIVSQAGNSLVTEGTIGMMMVNVEEERMMRAPAPHAIINNGHHSFANPEIKLNLYVVFAANHNDHREALILLSYIVRYFQAKNVFDNQESPQLGDSVEKLIVDLHTLTFDQQNQLWSSLGAKYMPSLVYRVRMVVVDEQQPLSVAKAITSIENSFADKTE